MISRKSVLDMLKTWEARSKGAEKENIQAAIFEVENMPSAEKRSWGIYRSSHEKE